MTLYAIGERQPTIDPAAFVHPDAIIIGDVHLGPEASVWPGAVLRGDHGSIYVGAGSSVQDGSVVHCTATWDTVIGQGCVIGHLVHLEGCTVQDDALVGSGAVVLQGVHRRLRGFSGCFGTGRSRHTRASRKVSNGRARPNPG